jgi:hypothetical protein
MSTAPTPPPGRVLDAALELLDRQIVDKDDEMAGKVDDLELTVQSDGTLLVTGILSGPGALGPRLGGRLGAAWSSVFARLHPDRDPEPAAIGFGAVTSLGPQVRILASRRDLDTDRFEAWTRDQLIGRIPGARRASE